MGSRIRSGVSKNYEANRTAFESAKSTYESKLKFGKTSTRSNGLSEAEIGPAPVMQFSNGFAGDAERSKFYQDPTRQRRRGGLGFGGQNPLLG